MTTESWDISDRKLIQAFLVRPQKSSVFIRIRDPVPINKGAFGTVFRATVEQSNGFDPQIVAAKRVVHNSKCKDREFDLLSIIDHPNIVELRYFFRIKNEAGEVLNYFLFEHMPCSLYDYIEEFRSHTPIFVYDDMKIYLIQMFHALSYIHKLKICHRDIKPQNILIDCSKKIVKICDFGSAKILSDDSPSIHYICSRYYRAPELILGMTRYTTKIDMWSIGCVLAEMISGVPLFAAEASVGVMDIIIKTIGAPTQDEISFMNPSYHRVNGGINPSIIPLGFRTRLKKPISDELLAVLEKLIVYDPNVRYSSEQCLQMSVFQSLSNSQS